MKPFNSKAFCPKCRSKDIGTLFCKVRGMNPMNGCDAYAHQDHFHRNCHRCGYEWFEAVALTRDTLEAEIKRVKIVISGLEYRFVHSASMCNYPLSANQHVPYSSHYSARISVYKNYLKELEESQITLNSKEVGNTMKTYQTRPVVVQAMQWLGHAVNNKDVREYKCETAGTGAIDVYDMRLSPPETKTYLLTLPGDWIIYQDGFPTDVIGDKVFNRQYERKGI